MSRYFARARFGLAVATAFVVGLVFASAMDLTRYGHAQQNDAPLTQQEVQPLAEVSSAFNAIADEVTPAVVSINAETDRESNPRSRGRVPPGLEDFFRQFEGQVPDEPISGTGSGFIVSKDGYILTNNHVVADADRVTVRMVDNRVFAAEVVGRDPTTDVAVIKIAANNLPVVQLGDDTNARIGDWVLAIGNPLGLDFTVTAGIVSAKGRNVRGLLPGQFAISDFIQTDAAINPGNSGGPLVNIRGEVIGINSAIASQTGFYSGYGFAIPITLAKQVMQELIEYGEVRPAMLGVAINDVDAVDARAAGLEEIRGVQVEGFSGEDSPARAAGIEPGDIIVGVNGQPVDRVSALQRAIRTHEPGSTITLDLMRFGERRTVSVKLGERETPAQLAGSGERTPEREPASYDRLGIEVETIPAEFIRESRLTPDQRGVIVTDVSPAGPSHRRLLDRDVIIEILDPAPRRKIRTVADFERAVEQIEAGEIITVLVYNLESLVQTGQETTRVVSVRVGD
ncbi:MAG: Do family serine endopeptidase [Gemmatimonadaceae bacterium]